MRALALAVVLTCSPPPAQHGPSRELLHSVIGPPDGEALGERRGVCGLVAQRRRDREKARASAEGRRALPP